MHKLWLSSFLGLLKRSPSSSSLGDATCQLTCFPPLHLMAISISQRKASNMCHKQPRLEPRNADVPNVLSVRKTVKRKGIM